jgi:hypothetical protein
LYVFITRLRIKFGLLGVGFKSSMSFEGGSGDSGEAKEAGDLVKARIGRMGNRTWVTGSGGRNRTWDTGSGVDRMGISGRQGFTGDSGWVGTV